jgi:hypothetical protein
MHALLAVYASTLLTLLPRRPVKTIAVALFGAVVLLRGQHGEVPCLSRGGLLMPSAVKDRVP